MRRSRRGLSGGHEFGGSGEDSFVAVVVTKLTGALLFILLLTMVIMALIPKADEAARAKSGGEKSIPLRIATPENLPEAIEGHPYTIALAAEGGSGPLTWRIDGTLPEGLTLDPKSGIIRGTPKAKSSKPSELIVGANDGKSRASSRVLLTIFQPDSTLGLNARLSPGLPPVAWKSWMQQGFGFLVLLLVYMTGMNIISGLERLATTPDAARRFGRFFLYRLALCLGSLTTAAVLAAWIWRGRSG